MKIIIIGSTNFDSLEFHMRDSLIYLGHDVHILDYFKVLPWSKKCEYWVRRSSESYSQFVFIKLADKTIQLKPDLVIVTYRDVHPTFINRIRKKLRETKIIHVNPDQLTTIHNQQIFASNYDAYFTKDKFMLAFMRDKMDLNAFYLPECFNQRYCQSDFESKKIAEEKIQVDVLVYGNFYPYRNRMIEVLIRNGINVKLCGYKGPYFPKEFKNFYHAPIYGKEKANYILGSKVVFNNFHYAEVDSVNEKYFVINGVGGFQICDFRACLSELSLISPEKYSFRNIEEGVRKIKSYLSNSERLYLAEANKKYFIQNHTYDKRMSEMLYIIQAL